MMKVRTRNSPGQVKRLVVVGQMPLGSGVSSSEAHVGPSLGFPRASDVARRQRLDGEWPGCR